MVRGNDRAKIFRDDEDNKRFLKRRGHTVEEEKSSGYARALMDTEG
jgi:hypothetical protein